MENKLLQTIKKPLYHIRKLSSMITKKWNCIKMDMVRVENCSSNSTSVVELRSDSVNAANNLQPGLDW